MKQQGGFTLIELVVVIVILGILSATALPKFIDLRSDADKAAVAGVAGGLSSAASVNYAGRLVKGTVSGNGTVPVLTCGDVSNAMQSWPAGYAIASPATAVSSGGQVTCTVSNTSSSATANFTAIGIT